MRKIIFFIVLTSSLGLNFACDLLVNVYSPLDCTNGVYNAFVTLTGPNYRSAGYTNKFGQITFTGMPSETGYKITITHPAWSDKTVEVGNPCAMDAFSVCFDPPGGKPTDANKQSNSLLQNYPNPFNPETSITFSVEFPNRVKLTVYDLLGKEICTLVNEYKDGGVYSFKFNSSDISSGMYFYKIEIGSFSDIKKMLVIK